MLFLKQPTTEYSGVYYLLSADNWDDFCYRTSFQLYRVEDGKRVLIGFVKIAKTGMAEASYSSGLVSDSRATVPDQFNTLDSPFFSLGQGTSYYLNLKKYPEEREEVLVALRDIAFDTHIRSIALDEEVTTVSLLRDLTEVTVARQFNRIAQGYEEYASFTIPVIFEPSGKDYDGYSSRSVVFDFRHDTLPPTNLQAIIGENGVGKTYLLHRLVRSYYEKVCALPRNALLGENYEDNEMFTNLTVVSSSSLDAPFISETQKKKLDQLKRSSYLHELSVADFAPITISQSSPKKSSGSAFRRLLRRALQSSPENKENWKFIFKHLTEPFDGLLFGRDIDSILYSFDEETPDTELQDIQDEYVKMSTGQKVVLTVLTDIAVHMKEQSLLLMDEPESFLHPPLLSSMIRTISAFCKKMNAAVVVATHSPIVIQEIPRQAVKVFEKREGHAIVRSPRIETFGENIGTLSSEVFGIDSTKAGFYRLIQEQVDEGETLSEILNCFHKQLGSEALSYLQLLVEERNTGEAQ
jgi:predicted ATPase